MKKNGYRQATERDDISRPTGKDRIFRAYDKRTGAYLGVVIHETAYPGARDRASELYAVPPEVIIVK
jgi:hypothetical protein